MDATELERLVAAHRRELFAHCYRMLGSASDADDALQDALAAAWRGREGFEGRGTARAWLYRIATNACLRLIDGRKRRILPDEHGPPSEEPEVAPMDEGVAWLEPYPDGPEASVAERESVELAFAVALQALPATQRAALLLAEPLGFSAAEIAAQLDTSVPSVNSLLQRARTSLAARAPARSQQATLRELGDARAAALVRAFADAWMARDVAALVALLIEDARFTMPPIPTWFAGRRAVARFFAERVFGFEWRLAPTTASAQPALAGLMAPDFRPSALAVLTLEGDRVAAITGFLDPAVHRRFRFPDR